MVFALVVLAEINFLIKGIIIIIKNPIAKGAIIGNSGTTVVPITLISPAALGLMEIQTCVPLFFESLKYVFSSSRNIAYGPHNSSNGIIVVMN